MKSPYSILFASLLAIFLSPFFSSQDTKSEAALRLIHGLVEKTNIERISRGLPPLYLNDSLTRASVAHARDMAKFGYFGHSTPNAPDGTEDFESYANSQNYTGKTGQNLYHGEPRAEQIVQQWMKSEEHRENILDPLYNEVGIGFARGRDYYDTYCVQFFGVNKGLYPVIINNEAYSTSKIQVRLYIYGKGRMTQMRFSNDGVKFTAWEPFKTERDWTLDAKEGPRTVTVELSDEVKTYRSVDTILYVRPVSTP